METKQITFVLLLLLNMACHRQETILNGHAKGIRDAVIEVSGHKKLWDANIVDEKFLISAGPEPKDFYKLKIRFSGSRQKTAEHIVYLDQGTYNIELDSASIQSYPRIKTQVKFQNELSDYYLSDSPHSLRLENFVRNHPESLVSAYLLSIVSENEFQKNPGYYDQIFRLLDPQIKETSYGKSAKEKIDGFSRILPGAVMPNIDGRTPHGKPFDRNLLKGKLTLVAFWASWNYPSLNDLAQLKFFYDKNHSKGFEILSIAIDKTEERWKRAIAANDLNWLHVTDFKGAYSKNFENFYTNKLPYYVIIGPDMKIIDVDVPVESVGIYFNDFLEQASAE